MNPSRGPVHERAATLPLDQQTASGRVVARQKSPSERKQPGKSTATSLLRLLYWIYERRLLHQLKQTRQPRKAYGFTLNLMLDASPLRAHVSPKNIKTR